MPYPNPDMLAETGGADYSSVCVCFPDLPEYRAALLGSLNYLAQWTAWERDDQHTALRSAALWKVANDATKECWDMPCNQSSEPVVVNVTVNNSCGGGGDSSTAYCVDDDGVITINPPAIGEQPVTPPDDLPPGMELPPEIVDPGVGEPPQGWPDWETYDQDACAAANSMVESQYEFWRRTEDFFGQDVFTMAAYFVVMWNIFAVGGWSVLFKRELALKITEIVGRISFLGTIGAYAGGVADDIQENRANLVCELYSTRGNYSSWSNTLTASIMSFVAKYLQAGYEMNLVQELTAFTLPPAMSAWLMGKAMTSKLENSVSCAGCQSDEDWTFDYSSGYDGTSFMENVQNVDSYLKFEAHIYKTSNTGPIGFEAELLGISLTADPIAYTFTLESDFGRIWFLRFYNNEVMLHQHQLIGGDNQVSEFTGMTTANRVILAMNTGSYYETTPFILDVSLSCPVFTRP